MTVVEKKATLNEAFQVADDVVRQGVQGISDIITIPGMINVDFADVKAIMENQGTALMGIGRASRRAEGQSTPPRSPAPARFLKRPSTALGACSSTSPAAPI